MINNQPAANGIKKFFRQENSSSLMFRLSNRNSATDLSYSELYTQFGIKITNIDHSTFHRRESSRDQLNLLQQNNVFVLKI